ncbi:MAG: hydrogenase 4 subunit B [Thermodesulfovibrionales bacterium]|jgi:hydrogenase-4 component B
MVPENYLFTGILFFLSGAVMSCIVPQKAKNYTYVLSAIGAVNLVIAGLYLSAGTLISVPSIPISPALEFSFQVDALSGFFVTVISILTLAVSIYSIGYTKNIGNQGLMGFLYNLFILSMYAVVLSGNLITFLISWETMSVVSYFLVTFDRDEKSAKAGLLYAVMTHIGTAFIIILFLALYKYTGHMDFSGMRAASAGIPKDLKTLIFIFSIIGFGTKAGIIPFHTWLPRAHPAAPSNISSLMSGVMIKTGIYGFIRISMDVLGHGPEWWGITIIVIGAVSSVIGVLYALMEHDIKKLLAYHSIENIGIILLGIGSSMMFGSNGMYTLSAIAFIAGLYHTLNHAIFKGLLFLGAGSVMHATHTKNMEDMGGLIKSMPYTGLFFLIGSVSICALPPFNGFVSEWLTYQALLLGFNAPSITSKIISPLGGAALALTGALAAACFVKAFGISFLGVPRSPHARDAKESSASMIVGMAILAVLCLTAGIFPGTVIGVISPSVIALTGSDGNISYNGLLSIGKTFSSLAPAAILISMLCIGAAIAVFIIAAGKRKTVYADSWDCGMPSLTSRMQYTATAFTKPIRLIFKRIYLPKRELSISYILKPLFVRSLRYSGEITPFFERYMYEPLTAFIRSAASKARMLQSGNLNLYLGYILITLMLLLIFGI